MKIYKMRVWVKRSDSHFELNEIREGTQGFFIQQKKFFEGKALNNSNQKAGCHLVDIYENGQSIVEHLGIGDLLKNLSENEIFDLSTELRKSINVCV